MGWGSISSCPRSWWSWSRRITRSAAGVGADGRAGDEQFISFREGARLRELLFAAGRQAGFEPRVTLESNESHRIRRLVARGLGVAILPRSDAEGPGADVAVVPLVEPALRRDITLAWREGRRHAPAAAAFLDLARETFSRIEPAENTIEQLYF